MRVGDRWDDGFRSRKTAALFAYLALHPQRPHRRDFLCELLWPETDEDRARNSLTTALGSIRQLIARAGFCHDEVLETRRDTIQLSPGRIQVDYARFEQVVRQRDDGREGSLRQAVDLYGSGLLGRLDEPWLSTEQTRAAAVFADALQELIDLLAGSNRIEEAIGYATRATTADPLDDAAHCRLARLYARSGHVDHALATLYDLKRRLRGADSDPGAAVDEMIRELQRAPKTPSPPHTTTLAPRESLGGAMPLNSPWYLRRRADSLIEQALDQGERVIRVTGPRESGKSSLLARARAGAAGRGWMAGFTSIGSLKGAKNEAECCLRLGQTLAEALSLSVPRAGDDLAPPLWLRRYLRQTLLPRARGRLVWLIDDLDQLLDTSYGDAIFAMLRAWCEEGAADPILERLTLVISYSAEVHLRVANLNHSPFNIGARVEAEDFDLNQLLELNRLGGAPLTEAGVGKLTRLVGGHPYLTRRALDSVGYEGLTADSLESCATRPDSPFRAHLSSVSAALASDMLRQLIQLAEGRGGVSEDSFYRLRSAGVLAGAYPDDVRFRCDLYARYLRSMPQATREVLFRTPGARS